jgi:hypothetical protein
MSDDTGSSCPEEGNSTDCLLRLVLRTLEARSAAEDGKFDWDPITFAFTVPISIFAATFALITIYQAILAAGPGRRKSNRRAIGGWADETRKEWNWHDHYSGPQIGAGIAHFEDASSESEEARFHARDGTPWVAAGVWPYQISDGSHRVR